MRIKLTRSKDRKTIMVNPDLVAFMDSEFPGKGKTLIAGANLSAYVEETIPEIEALIAAAEWSPK